MLPLCTLWNVQSSVNRGEPEIKKWYPPLPFPQTRFSLPNLQTPPQPTSLGSAPGSPTSKVCGSQGHCKDRSHLGEGGMRNILPLVQNGICPVNYLESKLLGRFTFCSPFCPMLAHPNIAMTGKVRRQI